MLRHTVTPDTVDVNTQTDPNMSGNKIVVNDTNQHHLVMRQDPLETALLVCDTQQCSTHGKCSCIYTASDMQVRVAARFMLQILINGAV